MLSSNEKSSKDEWIMRQKMEYDTANELESSHTSTQAVLSLV